MNESELPLHRFARELYERYRHNAEGKVADYIPELGKANPDHFGIAIATADGFIYRVGDADHEFTAQSVSKPLVYALALEEHGFPAVHAKIGVEPSGDAFNSITFDERHNRPFNPMVNAGAITAASLVTGRDLEDRFGKVTAMFELFFGRKPTLDTPVYRSELETGDRNRAIAYLARNAGMIDGDVSQHLDLYFRQCSLRVTACDLAVAAATLANDGVNPVTGKRALRSEHVRAVLSVMSSCGMYDYAGEWQFEVGLPAKSGVSGGVMATLPGQFGVGTYSPLVDNVGNSVRGIKVCEDLSTAFRLHLLEQRGPARTAIRRSYPASRFRSKRVRQPQIEAGLATVRDRMLVLELQGDLLFAEAEKVTRHTLSNLGTAQYVIIDTKRLFRADRRALDFLYSLQESFERQNKRLLFAGPKQFLPQACHAGPPSWFPDLDTAIEFLEDRALPDDETFAKVTGNTTSLEAFDVLGNMSAEEIEALRKRLVARKFLAGEHIIQRDDPSDWLYFLTEGRVNVMIPIEDERGLYRISAIDSGNLFGELAPFGSQRSADITGATDGEALVLTQAALGELSRECPAAYHKLLLSVGRSLAEHLRRANDDIRTLVQ